MPKLSPKRFWSTTDGRTVRLYQGDVLELLARLPERSVQTVVTSPPYWGLRDYGTDKSSETGSERTPEEYIARLVEVFRGIWRVLRDDGTLWLNLGDRHVQKNLLGMPWRVALALQADGWYLRRDVIWNKSSCMVESVRDRPAGAHEYLFLMSKKPRYYYDAEAIKEAMAPASITRYLYGHGGEKTKRAGEKVSRVRGNRETSGKRNKRSVWTIPTQGYPGAHYATYPEKLVEPCILAGTSAYGACAACGVPWKRVVERERKPTRSGTNTKTDGLDTGITGNRDPQRHCITTKTIGWEPTCNCGTSEVRPCMVLDPFVGSGTTCCVALAHGRHSIGIDLSVPYLRNNAIPRIEGALLTRPALAHLTGRKLRKVLIGRKVGVKNDEWP